MPLLQVPMATNYEVFLKTDLSEYTGKWIAIADNKVVSSGDNVKEVMDKATKAAPKKKVTLVKVPEEETLIF
jgi:hypothetical protein